MDWQKLFPNHTPSVDDDDSSVIRSFGEAPAHFKQLLLKTVISSDRRGFIKLSGPDSEKFLQGQVTCDLSQLDDGSLKGAHLTPKGRIIFLFNLTREDNGDPLLETHPSVVHVALANLKKYAIFFKTEITDVSDDFQQIILSGPEAESLMESINPVASTQINKSVFSLTLSIETPLANLAAVSETAQPAGQSYSDMLRVQAGMADIQAQTSDKFIVQMLNLDAQSYISFKKGCYTGQEIVARAHYRGAVKRRMVRLMLTTPTMPKVGDELHDGNNKTLGNVLGSCRSGDQSVEVLAVLPAKSTSLDAVKFGQHPLCEVALLPLPYSIPNTP